MYEYIFFLLAIYIINWEEIRVIAGEIKKVAENNFTTKTSIISIPIKTFHWENIFKL